LGKRRQRRHDFTRSAHDGSRRLHDEERYILSDARSDHRKVLQRHGIAESLVEPEQNGRGIGAATAEPCAHWNDFGDGDVYARVSVDGTEITLGGQMTKVAGVERYAGKIAADVDAVAIMVDAKLDNVGNRVEPYEQRADAVIPVRKASRHLERQIELRRCRHPQHRIHHRCSSLTTTDA